MSESSKQATVTKEQTGETMSLHSWIGENSSVLVKLMVFTAALFAFPIVTFFATLHSLFDGMLSVFLLRVYVCVCVFMLIFVC